MSGALSCNRHTSLVHVLRRCVVNAVLPYACTSAVNSHISSLSQAAGRHPVGKAGGLPLWGQAGAQDDG